MNQTEVLEKSLLRKQCQTITAKIPKKDKILAGEKVTQHLLDIFKALDPSKKGVTYFKNYKNEIDTQFLGLTLKENGYSLYIPRLTTENLLYFAEEETAQTIKNSQIHIMLVPGLAFDKKGNRLGRGRGCYDKFIASVSNQAQPPITIGIGFDEQLFDQIPVEPHDKLLHMIVTPSFTIQID